MSKYYDKFKDWYDLQNPNLQKFVIAVGVLVVISIVVGFIQLL